MTKSEDRFPTIKLDGIEFIVVSRYDRSAKVMEAETDQYKYNHFYSEQITDKISGEDIWRGEAIIHGKTMQDAKVRRDLTRDENAAVRLFTDAIEAMNAMLAAEAKVYAFSGSFRSAEQIAAKRADDEKRENFFRRHGEYGEF